MKEKYSFSEAKNQSIEKVKSMKKKIKTGEGKAIPKLLFNKAINELGYHNE